MKKLCITMAILFMSANIFAATFTCPVMSIDYQGKNPKIPGWVSGLTEDSIPNGTYYLAASLSSRKHNVLAGCIYSLDGQINSTGFPNKGGIWLLGPISTVGEGIWLLRSGNHNSPQDMFCSGTFCSFKSIR